ncbi:hypothetical protein D0809_27530, partial [Flavobacterium circumlabens]
TLASPEILAQEKAALIALYNSTNGAAWTNTKNNQGAWPVNDPNSVVTRDWAGVSVDGAGRVTMLNLSSNNLTGVLPNLNALTELSAIWLQGNKIQGGNIDTFSESTKLSLLNIQSCNLDGNLQSL